MDPDGKPMIYDVSLLPTDLEHIDKISTALDHCVQVRLYK